MELEKNIKKLTDGEFFNTVIESGKPAVVDFGAKWCVPCRRVDDVLNRIAPEFEDKVSIYKVDVNESSQTASKYSVRNIPMLLFFKGGEIVDQAVGSISEDTIEEKLQSMLK
jgi:thioredoxin 1